MKVTGDVESGEQEVPHLFLDLFLLPLSERILKLLELLDNFISDLLDTVPIESHPSRLGRHLIGGVQSRNLFRDPVK